MARRPQRRPVVELYERIVDAVREGTYPPGSTLPSEPELAAALGAFDDGASVEPGGARLLYVAKSDRTGAATERGQRALDPERIQVWLDVVHSAAASSLGPAYVANENPDCPRCPARTCCPVHPAGRQVAQ